MASPDVRHPCDVDIAKDLGAPQPLYIRPGTSRLLYPSDRSGILTLEESQQIELFCKNGFSSPRGVDGDLVSVACAYGNRFRLNSKLHTLSEFVCQSYSAHTLRRRATSRCFNKSTIVDVGFQVGERFVQTIAICHNPATEQTYFAKYRLTPANVAAQQGFKRPQFSQSDFFPGKDINALYKRLQQRAAIAEIIKSDEQADRLVQDDSDVFLSRGKASCRGFFSEIDGKF